MQPQLCRANLGDHLPYPALRNGVEPKRLAASPFTEVPGTFYAGTQPRLDVVVTDTVGARRDDVPVAFSSSDAAVATLDRFGFLALRAPGTATVTAAVDTESDALTIEVVDVKGLRVGAKRIDLNLELRALQPPLVISLDLRDTVGVRETL